MQNVGDGVFETLLVVESRPHALTRHLARMAASAKRLGMAVPDPAVVHADVKTHLTANPLPYGRLRTDWVSEAYGPSLSITSRETEVPAPTARLALDAWRVDKNGPLAGIKSTQYEGFAAARERAIAVGADDALLLNTAGDVCETSTANVFYVVDGALYTPPCTSGCLPGIARGLILDLCDVSERRTSLETLMNADEVFITSSLRAVQPVAAVGTQAYPTPGPITLEAMDAWQRLAETTWDPAPLDNSR